MATDLGRFLPAVGMTCIFFIVEVEGNWARSAQFPSTSTLPPAAVVIPYATQWSEESPLLSNQPTDFHNIFKFSLPC